MRIAIISPAHPFRGGIAQFTDVLVDTLRRRDHDVRIFSFSRQYPAFLFPGKTQRKEGDHSPSPATSETIDSVNPFTWYSTARQIADHSPDLVIVSYWMPFFAPALGTIVKQLKKKTDARHLAICHNIVPHEKRPGDRMLTRLALKDADQCIVLSSTVARDIREIIPDMRVSETPHPVYDVYGEPIPRVIAKDRLGLSDEHVLLFFGLVREYKGLDILIKALPDIREKIPCRLVVAGEFYDDEAKYRSLIAASGLSEFVSVDSRFIPDDEVATYFSAADVVVLPYRSATQSGIVQIAMHFDRSCIVTDVGALAEVVRDDQNGFVVPAEDSEALAAAVVKFFHEDHQQAFEQAVHDSKSAFSWSRFAELVEESSN